MAAKIQLLRQDDPLAEKAVVLDEAVDTIRHRCAKREDGVGQRLAYRRDTPVATLKTPGEVTGMGRPQAEQAFG